MKLKVALLALALASNAFAKPVNQEDVRRAVRIDQLLGKSLPMDAEFRNEKGQRVFLRDLFKSGRPVVITPVYYSCPMLCNVVLDQMVNRMADLRFDVGREFDIITYSFDAKETPPEAEAKKVVMVRRYGREGAAFGWSFLTGDERNIQKLSDALGFHFAWDGERKEYAHAAAVMVATPDGKIARYLNGMEYSARDLRLAIVEASANKIGSPVDRLLLLCYHYDPGSGTYSARAMNVMRLGGVATVLGLGSFIFVMIRKERSANR